MDFFGIGRSRESDKAAQRREVLAQIEVAAKLKQETGHAHEQLEGLLARTLANFNALLREQQLGAIVVPTLR